ncbi:glycosyltransferase [Candidatus Pacearchaeota archaeon]|nr:MAG: glycosyltransferase [Candidatus Pacearchaeota archaeon]
MIQVTRKTSISLCMIVRNEEKNIKKCLSSVRALVDEIVVVDTGSSDNTKEIAREFGAKIFSAAWEGDFAKARNISLEKATKDWILVLDADELISPKDHKKIVEFLSQTDAVGVALITRNYTPDSRAAGWKSVEGDEYAESQGWVGWYENFKIRLFRNNPKVKFSGKVHESVRDSLKSLGKIVALNVPVHHYGYFDKQSMASKGKVYEKLGAEKLNESNDWRACYELGRQCLHNGEVERALELFARATELNPNDFKSWFMLGSAYLLSNANDALDKAIEALNASLKINPNYNATYTNIGIAYAKQGKTKRAIEFFKKSISLNNKDANAYKNLGICYQSIGERGKAREAFERALELNPSLKGKIKLD